MLIRGRISRDFFEQEPHSVDWLGPVIWAFVALALASSAALIYASLNFSIVPLEFDAHGLTF
jgi:hypothetical protein